MALNPLNSSNLEQLALKGLTHFIFIINERYTVLETDSDNVY